MRSVMVATVTETVVLPMVCSARRTPGIENAPCAWAAKHAVSARI